MSLVPQYTLHVLYFKDLTCFPSILYQIGALYIQMGLTTARKASSIQCCPMQDLPLIILFRIKLCRNTHTRRTKRFCMYLSCKKYPYKYLNLKGKPERGKNTIIHRSHHIEKMGYKVDNPPNLKVFTWWYTVWDVHMHKLSRQVNCCRKAVHNFHGMKTNVHVHKHLEVTETHVRVTHHKQTQNK